jgi:hypothetical protein
VLSAFAAGLFGFTAMLRYIAVPGLSVSAQRAMTRGWALSSRPHPAEPGVAPTETHLRVLLPHLGEAVVRK